MIAHTKDERKEKKNSRNGTADETNTELIAKLLSIRTLNLENRSNRVNERQTDERKGKAKLVHRKQKSWQINDTALSIQVKCSKSKEHRHSKPIARNQSDLERNSS